MKTSPRPPRINRGSSRRVQRIKLGGNWSIEIWIVIAIMLITLLVVVPWLVRHPLTDPPLASSSLDRD